MRTRETEEVRQIVRTSFHGVDAVMEEVVAELEIVDGVVVKRAGQPDEQQPKCEAHSSPQQPFARPREQSAEGGHRGKDTPVDKGLAGYECGTAAACEQGQDLRPCGVDTEPIPGAEVVDFAVLDELIGPADADHGNRASHLFKGFNDG